jgi:hypothetical protein
LVVLFFGAMRSTSVRRPRPSKEKTTPPRAPFLSTSERASSSSLKPATFRPA